MYFHFKYPFLLKWRYLSKEHAPLCIHLTLNARTLTESEQHFLHNYVYAKSLLSK